MEDSGSNDHFETASTINANGQLTTEGKEKRKSSHSLNSNIGDFVAQSERHYYDSETLSNISSNIMEMEATANDHELIHLDQVEDWIQTDLPVTPVISSLQGHTDR